MMKFKVGDAVKLKEGRHAGKVAAVTRAMRMLEMPAYMVDVDPKQWYTEDLLEACDHFVPSIRRQGCILQIESDAPTTTIYWSTGEKSEVTCAQSDEFDPVKGIALAIMKYALGNDDSFHEILHRVHKAQQLENKRQEIVNQIDTLLKELERICDSEDID